MDFAIHRAMTEGQMVKLDNGAVGQLKTLAVSGSAYATVLVAVLPPEHQARGRSERSAGPASP